MVASLDEIVWAINPTNDSVASLANYLCHFAEEFFKPTPIRCRLDVADALPSAPLGAEVRHHLYLAVREALNNIAKHSEATEVWLRIQVADSGLSIEIEDNGRGFQPRPAPTGEGLANMRQRLEKIGGSYECTSRPGAGSVSRFVLRLNRTCCQQTERGKMLTGNGRLPDGPVCGKLVPINPMLTSVAIVEDNNDFRASLERYVNEAPGYRCVCVCSTAEEALQKIPRVLPDVALMDIHLPNLSGVECTRRLKDLCPSVQILILTVYTDSERIFGALKAGASGYLLKRADPEDILRAIQEVKQGGAPMTSQIARHVVHSFRGDAPANQKVEDLSQREEEILQHLSKGYSTKEIAERLSVSVNTVRTHLQHIYNKLHVRSRTEAVVKFLH